MAEFKDLQHYKKAIEKRRALANQNNIFRTFYYKLYWQEHPEVPWAFLAHLVSRNAGYQMSDADRYQRVLLWSLGTLGVGAAAWGASSKQMEAFFAYLETGNFLIFRDVCPGLEAYRLAKMHPDHSDELFELLRNPAFTVDPFVIDNWKAFFAAAQDNAWSPEWSLDWSPGSAIQRHSFALIINEQNQIQDRLVSNNRYLGHFTSWKDINDMVREAGEKGWTRLCFPVAHSLGDATPDDLLIYTVGEFSDIDNRIETGRDLFVGLFGDLGRRRLIETWALSPDHLHSGSRRDYNRQDYSYSTASLEPGGDVFSPPVGYWNEKGYVPKRLDVLEPVWPFFPGRKYPFSLLHREPLKYSYRPVRSWIDYPAYLNPLRAPRKAFATCRLDQLCEVDKAWYLPS